MTSPAELMAMTSALVDGVRGVSAAMKAAVAELVADGWTETQARELVAALMLNGLRGQAPEPETEETTA